MVKQIKEGGIMDDIIVRLTRLPHSIHGFVAEDADGDFNIYLNNRHTSEANAQAYDHELRHISAGHFRRLEHVRDLEAET
jgi:hypothetical protein